MPGELSDLLDNRLPAALHASFNALVALPEHRSAWIAVQQNFQAELRSRTQRIEIKTDRVLEILEGELNRAREAQEISAREAQDARGRAEEYEKQYRKLLEDVSKRTEEPAEFAAALAAGDLEGAARLKTRDIQARKGEVKKLARDWSELGRVQDLRFAWRQALECYREAWRLDPNEVEYGFQRIFRAEAESARECNRNL